MELRVGYRETEVGAIPQGWEVKSLGQFVALQRGHDLTERQRRQGDVPVMGSAGPNGFHDTARAKGPGVILGRSGASFGQAHYCESDFWPHNTALYVTDFFGNLPLFVFYFLKSIDFSRHNSGGAQQSLNRNFIAPIQVAVPPRPEQEIITNALSDVDALITALDALIGKKRDLKQAAMQQLITGKIRLPGFKDEWKVRPLGDVARIRNEKINTFGSGEAEFCVELEQIGQSTGRIDGFTDARDRSSSKYLFRRDDVLFGRLRPYLRKFWQAECNGVCSTEIWPLIPIDNRIAAPFLFQTVRTDAFIEAANTAYGTHMPRADWNVLKRFNVNVPNNLREQSAVASVLSDMDANITALTDQRDKARALKQGMMQELLTGRVRLV
jgi:type I restriction enzyme S subunit